jgi:hypothetical protein
LKMARSPKPWLKFLTVKILMFLHLSIYQFKLAFLAQANITT